MIESARRARMNVACRALVRACVSAIVLAAPLAAFAQSIDVKDAWLKRNCLDRGTSDHPLHGKEFESCLRKQIEALPPLDKSRREFFGERYDPSKYVECRLQPGSRNNSACDVHILRRREWPEYWPEGAKRVKWPEAPKESVYRKGMKPKEYWEALCKAEAGEFVSSFVTNVEGLYQVRPRAYETDYEQQDRFVLEDPVSPSSFLGNPALENELVQPYSGRYRFIESPTGVRGKFTRHFRVDPSRAKKKFPTARDRKPLQVPYIIDAAEVAKPSARYGIVWRGIQRPYDRENGIAGNEVAIVDLVTGDTLALRRGFALSGQVKSKASGFWWLSALRCPDDRETPTKAFLYNVLRPFPNVNDDIRPLEN